MSNQTGARRRSVVFYPQFRDKQELAEHYHRLRWYLPEGSPYDVYLLHDPSLHVSKEELDALLPEYLDEPAGRAENVHLLPWSGPRFAALASRAVTVGIWKTNSAKVMDKLSVLLGRRFVVLDTTAKGTLEYARYATLPFNKLRGDERAELRRRSHERLRGVANDLKDYKKAYVFGTGPSLARATEFDYSDGVRIVCNSIVRNPELLEHIKPHFITASDFVFHYGPSRYAAEFRRDLLNALESTGAYFLVPDQCAPLMFNHYPQLEAKTIAVPITNQYNAIANRKGPNLQLLDRFEVLTLDSVLNLLMLPVASALADEINVIGCDGRKPSDKAFWSHHSASQYQGLMATVNQTHPGFFAVDYVDYYERYCAHVAAVVAAGEALGKRYASLTPSLIPALSARGDGREPSAISDQLSAISFEPTADSQQPTATPVGIA